MVRRLLIATLLGGTMSLLVAGCGASHGTHTPSVSPSPVDSTNSTSSRPSSTSSRAPAPSSSTSVPKSTGAVATPTVTPPAQAAVNAYIALENALAAASRDPKHADLAAVNRYLSGKALTLFGGSLRAMSTAGQAYRGTPASPRIKVQSVVSNSYVVLTSCPKANTADPYVRYDVRTGQAIKTQKQSPPPPYLATLPMKKINGHWKLIDFLQNVGKTCSG